MGKKRHNHSKEKGKNPTRLMRSITEPLVLLEAPVSPRLS